MTFSKGDIVVLPYPFSDQTGDKLRPAVVISNSVVNKTKEIILAAITSNVRNDEFSFLIEDSIVTKSLRSYCEIRCHKLFTAEKDMVTKKISAIQAQHYSKLYDKIISLLS